MISIFVVEVTCNTTGETATICGCLRKISATRIGTGAPPNAARLDDPGGRTVRSAPIPTWRDLLSTRMPSANPTIISISVTSTATAKIEIMDRIGRWTRLARIILFIKFKTAENTCAFCSPSQTQNYCGGFLSSFSGIAEAEDLVSRLITCDPGGCVSTNWSSVSGTFTST